MFQQHLLATLFLVFCIGTLNATYTLEEGIKKLFLAKYRLLERPIKALTRHCAEYKPLQEKGFECEVFYLWREDSGWHNVCTRERSRWSRSFPKRKYKIVLRCTWNGHALSGLRSEWYLHY